jgi:hypothetical protein
MNRLFAKLVCILILHIDGSTSSHQPYENSTCIWSTRQKAIIPDKAEQILVKIRDIRAIAQSLLTFVRKQESKDYPGETQRFAHSYRQEATDLHFRVSDSVENLIEVQEQPPDPDMSDIGLRMLMPLDGEIVHVAEHYVACEVLLPANSDAQVIVLLNNQVRFHAWLNCSSFPCGGGGETWHKAI